MVFMIKHQITVKDLAKTKPFVKIRKDAKKKFELSSAKRQSRISGCLQTIVSQTADKQKIIPFNVLYIIIVILISK